MNNLLGIGIIIILVILLINKIRKQRVNLRTTPDSTHPHIKKVNYILVTHKNGIKHIDKDKFIDIIKQFKRNISKSINVSSLCEDKKNCNILYIKGLDCKYKINDWKEKQKNINFIKNQLSKNENEIKKKHDLVKQDYKFHNRRFHVSIDNEPYEDIFDPNTIGSQSPIKTKKLLIEIINELNNIEKNKDYINNENFDISPLQILMDSIENITENKYYKLQDVSQQNDLYNKNYYELNNNIRNKIKKIQCHEGECGLKDEILNDTGLLIARKSRGKKKQFPDLANVKVRLVNK